MHKARSRDDAKIHSPIYLRPHINNVMSGVVRVKFLEFYGKYDMLIEK